MGSDKLIRVVHAEISPEFNRFVLGTGDVLRIAEQLGSRAASTGGLGVSGANGALFSLAPGVVELSVSVEIWAERPPDVAESPIDSLEFQLVASDTSLHLASISPSPRDVTLTLPEVKPYTVQAFVLGRETRRDEDFDIEIRVERWLIRLW